MIRALINKIMDKLHPPVKWEKVSARNNWYGVPKPGLTWEEVKDKTQVIEPIVPMTLPIVPKTCPECDVPLKKYESDYYKFEEGGGQFMVVGNYCPKGHWTHLHWA